MNPKKNCSVQNKSRSFSPSNFLVPGWSGEGLISKNALGLKNNHKKLVNSAISQLTSVNSNKRLQENIYQCFLSYSREHNLHLEGLDDSKSFWEHLQTEQSPHREKLCRFNELYCFRAVTIYLLKIRFIIILNQSLRVKTNETSLMNPIVFFINFLRKEVQRNYRQSAYNKMNIVGIVQALKKNLLFKI